MIVCRNSTESNLNSLIPEIAWADAISSNSQVTRHPETAGR